MAVMGFSCQTTGPIKPSSFAPPYFWVCHSCPNSFSTSRFFWAASRKALHRHEVCKTLATCVPLSNGPVFGDSFEKTSGHRTRQCSASYICDGRSACFSCQLNFVVHTVAHNPTSSAHMSPSCRLTVARKIFTTGYQDQFLEQSKAYVNVPAINSSYCAKKAWKDVTEALKKEKLDYKIRQIPNLTKQDGTDHQGSKLVTNNDVAHRLTSNSPCLLLKNPDSTSPPRCEIQPNFGNGDLRMPVMREPRFPNYSNLKFKGPYELPSPEKRHIINYGGFRSEGYISRQRLKSTPPKNINDSKSLPESLSPHYSQPNDYFSGRTVERQEKKGSNVDKINGNDVIRRDLTTEESVQTDMPKRTDTHKITSAAQDISPSHLRKKLGAIYEKVLVVDNISAADAVVRLLTNQYKNFVHACDTEVAKIDVKQETPVGHGEIICFSIYSGPMADFGNGKSCIWVDVLSGGGKNLISKFAPFFEDKRIKKVWHNYSFDNHVLENYGLKLAGFHADTMHMARLWNSSRRTEGGYSLESLTGDPSVISDARLCPGGELIGKVSMKTIFGRKKVKKDGSEGKVITIPSVEELQTVERKLWICYSALDSISTLRLYESLKKKLSNKEWQLDGNKKGTMFNFYEEYWRPFGELLVKMETEGMLVDRAYLSEIEKVAIDEQQVAADRFRDWASKYCPDAKYMNVGSDAQLRQLFFGGIQNRNNPDESLELKRDFKVPNIDKVIEKGKKAPTKFCTITLHRIFDKPVETDIYTASGWPSVSGSALKALAGKVSEEFEFTGEATQSHSDDNTTGAPAMMEEDDLSEDPDDSIDKTALSAVGGEQGIEACNAISALCEVCSIDSLISNFILPLQGSHVAGKNGRIHCSLNINTETGRLSARRPNLQNQPALEKDRYKIRQAFIAAPGNSLIVADYGQLELRILAHLANCKSMLDAFEAGGDFHSRTAMNMYPHIREAVQQKHVLLEWHSQPGEDKPPVPLLKDAFASERRKAKMLNFSIAYGKTAVGLARDWKVSVEEARKTVNLWYSDRKEVLSWQEERKNEARKEGCVHTLLGRARLFPSHKSATQLQKGHIERAAINTPVQGSAADVAMCAMLEISRNRRLKKLGWKLLLQVHDEVILEGPTESAELAKAIVVDCMSRPFFGTNILKVDLSVDAKCAQNWYSAK